MSKAIATINTEFRNVPLSQLNESKTNPRRAFDDDALEELAASIRKQGVLSPLLVRPLTENGFEIVFGARRYRAAQLAGQETLPVRIKQMSDAEVIEAQLVENLIRAEIHPMEEAQGFATLLGFEEPKYTIEQIAVRVGKTPSFVASRLKLIDLVPAVVEAFSSNEIGVGHALLLAKLPADQQPQALSACFKEVYSYNGSQKPARILLPIRVLQFWIETNVLLVLKDAPFDKCDRELVAQAGSCTDCPKRTGHNSLLFGDDLGRQGDRCTDPKCFQLKLAARVANAVAAKPELVQISTTYGTAREGSPVLPRNKYTTLREDKPKSKEEAQYPEFKVCKFTAEAIIAEGSDVGTIHKVCTNPACPVHHPTKTPNAGTSDRWKTEQERQRREEAISRVTGLRTLEAIGHAVPVRLMKRELLYVAATMISRLDLPRLEIFAKLHHLQPSKEDEPLIKTAVSYLLGLPEGTLGRFVIEMAILLRITSGQNSDRILAQAAKEYNVNADAIAATVTKEFADREKAKAAKKTAPRSPAKKDAEPARGRTAA